MNDDPAYHVSTITDAAGETWVARQGLGLGLEGMGESLHSHVEFIRESDGYELHGNVSGLDPASDEELRASLTDAQRRDRFIRGL